MAREWINKAIEELGRSEIPASRGFPAAKIPYLTEPVAVVYIDTAYERDADLVVHIFSPMSAGGTACEDMALRAIESMVRIGGLCELERCSFDSDLGLFNQRLVVQLPGAFSWEDVS